MDSSPFIKHQSWLWSFLQTSCKISLLIYKCYSQSFPCAERLNRKLQWMPVHIIFLDHSTCFLRRSPKRVLCLRSYSYMKHLQKINSDTVNWCVATHLPPMQSALTFLSAQHSLPVTHLMFPLSNYFPLPSPFPYTVMPRLQPNLGIATFRCSTGFARGNAKRVRRVI